MDVAIGTLHTIEAKDKEIISIKRANDSQAEYISITVPPEFSTTTGETQKKAILRAAVESALRGKKLIADDSDSKIKLRDLVDKLYTKNTTP